MPAITVDDLKDYVARIFARNTLKIGIVGNVDAATAGKIVDRIFGDLPAKANLVGVPEAAPQIGDGRVAVEIDVPQSVVMVGGAGIARKDPDFMAAYVLNHILGGGAFSSRLYREVREVRGLAYSVYSDAAAARSHRAVRRRHRDALRPRRTVARRDHAGNPPHGRGRADRSRTRRRQVLPQGLVCAALRHVEQDRRASSCRCRSTTSASTTSTSATGWSMR